VFKSTKLKQQGISWTRTFIVLCNFFNKGRFIT
jgi:hypothetical protein